MSTISNTFYSGMLGLGRGKAFSSNAVCLLALGVLLGGALVYWAWIGLAWRTFHGDDTTSILAIQGIMKHGYQLLPSGFIYYRGYLPNYLSAATSLVFGLNDFAVILPSLLMGIGSLWLTYLFGRDVLNRPWAGVAAAALLLALQFQASLSTSPRMYLALEFFAVLSSYWAWRGYVKGEGKYQWLTILALMGAVLSNHQSGVLLVAVPLAVVVTRWIRGEGRPQISFSHLLPLGGLALLFIAYYALHLYSLPASQPQIADRSGLQIDRVGINFDPTIWLVHLLALERLVPLSTVFSPLMALLFFRAYKERHVEANQGIVYAFLIFVLCGLITMLVIKTTALNFWVISLPVYATLLCTSIAYSVSWLSGKEFHLKTSGVANLRRATLAGALVGCAAIILLGISLALGPEKYLTLVRDGYGVPCSQGICSGTIKRQYSQLNRVIKRDDAVVSSNPFVTNYYLGQVDGWYREKIVPAGFSSFDSPTDEYFGIQLVDSEEELSRLRDGNQRVWLIMDHKANTNSSKESRSLIASSYTKYEENDYMTVYVNFKPIVRQ